MRRWCFGLTLAILVAIAASGCSTTPTPAATSYRPPNPTPKPTSVGQPGGAATTRYVCADGDGVMLRSDAFCQAKTASGMSDGTALQIMGEASSGCSAVRTPDGSTGYVPSKYLCSTISQSCAIKGNVGFDTGEKIYHVPGQEYYDATVIDAAYGERWFCSEAEAQAAGWRRARE
jgi:hypothetical protein